MHTLQVETDEGMFSIHHNGDWSGSVMITFPNPGPVVEFPAAVLRAIANKAVLAEVRSKLTTFIEDLEL